MERFNPITDLQPIDSVSVPTADISDEIEMLRLTLIQTKKETDNVINVIKDKNSSLNSDLKKIKNLNRRLNITIPRIPSMPGKAGVEFGEEVEQERRRKRSGLGLPRLPLIPFPSKVPTFKRPRLRKFALNTKKALDVYGAFQIGKAGINIAKDPKALNKIVKIGGELTKTPKIPALNKTISKGKAATTGNFFQGAINRVKKIFTPKTKEVPLSERMSTAFNKNRSIINKNKTEPFKKFEKLIGKNPEAQFQDYLRKSKLSSPSKLKIDLNKAYQNERTNLLKSYKSKKIDEKTFTIKSQKIQKEYLENVERINRYDLEVRQQFEKIRNFLKPKPRGRKSRRKPTLIDDFTKKQKQIKKEFPEFKGFQEKIDPSFRGDVKMNKDGTFKYIETPIKNPNLSSLNIDTGVTNTVIILTDPPIA